MSSAAQTSVPPSANESRRVGPYTLDREIGKGSFAVVYKGLHLARDAARGRDGDSAVTAEQPGMGDVRRSSVVAIKVVTRRKLTPKLLDNLEGEISILKDIKHPNVVELLDCVKTDSHIYLVMAFCSAGDLSLYIRKKGRIGDQLVYDESAARLDGAGDGGSRSGIDLYPHPEDGGLNQDVARSFVSQLAAALEFMRARNIVHRDIKPQNLLLSPPDEACLQTGHPRGIHQLKVADFGFARNLPAASLAETLCGSPLYMAPEILRYEKYDAKADLWSVGAVLYEMVVGKPPFRAANHVELLRKIERGEDRIRFPDERSPASLARERERREELGERNVEVKPPTPVAEDIKQLIRSLLKRSPVERMSFEAFFGSAVIQQVRVNQRERAKKVPSAAVTATTEAAIVGDSAAKDPQPAVSPQQRPPGHQRQLSASSRDQQRRSLPQEPRVLTATPSQQSASPPSGAENAKRAPAASQVRPAPASPHHARVFRTKYVVGGTVQASTGEPPREEQAATGIANASANHPGVPHNEMSGAGPRHLSRTPSLSATPPLYHPAEPSSLEDNVQTPSSSVLDLPLGGRRQQATDRGDRTLVPGTGAGVGGLLSEEELSGSREYVMVEKRAVEPADNEQSPSQQLQQSGQQQQHKQGRFMARVMGRANMSEAHSPGGSGAGAATHSTSPNSAFTFRPSRLSRLGSGLTSAAAAAWSHNHGTTAPATTSQASTAAAGRFVPATAPHISSSPSASGASAAPSAKSSSTPPPVANAPFAIPASARRPSMNSRRYSSSSNTNLATSPVSRFRGSPDLRNDENTHIAARNESAGSLGRASGRALPVPVPMPSHRSKDSPSPPGLNLSSLPAVFGSAGSSLGAPGAAMGPTSFATSLASTGSALARALNMASVRHFGVPSGMSLGGAATLVRERSSRRAALMRSGEYMDGAEAGLISTLEDLGQKAFVLSEFADSRLAAFFPVGPHQPSPSVGAGGGLANDGTTEYGVTSSAGANAFSTSPAEGRGAYSPHTRQRPPGLKAGAYASSFSPPTFHSPQPRPPSATSTLSGLQASGGGVSKASVGNADLMAEAAAAEALVLYVRSLGFLQRGIEATKLFMHARSETSSRTSLSGAGQVHGTSHELNEAMQWLRARFNEGYERADFARNRCGRSDELPESARDVERLIFDKALEIARSAALDELENHRDGVDWNAERCLLAYETASTMLCALLDPCEERSELSDGAAAKVEKFVKSINKRLSALQRRLEPAGAA